MFEGIPDIVTPLLILLAIMVPLGLWKMIDIVIWIFHHVSIVVQ